MNERERTPVDAVLDVSPNPVLSSKREQRTSSFTPFALTPVLCSRIIKITILVLYLYIDT